jgi:hypothetical protein
MRRSILRLIPALVLAIVPWLQAQSAAAQAVRGVVVDNENLSRVSAATVRLVHGDDAGQGAETDASGHFFLPVPGVGEYRLEVTRIGYRTTRSQTFRVEERDTVTVEFLLAPDVVLLAPLTVTARSTRGRNLFERHREEWGKGVFVTPQQIDSMHLTAPAEVFRKMKDVKLTWGVGDLSDGRRGPIPSVLSQQGTGCLLYMVNHVWVRPGPSATDEGPSHRVVNTTRSKDAAAAESSATWSGYQLGDLLPEDIAAVEVFRSISEVPPELRRYTHVWRKQPLANCGLVVFWTKSAW